MELTAKVRKEDGSYWAEVEQLPGCFASGSTLDELLEALQESVNMCIEATPESGRRGAASMQIDGIRLTS